jgi:hypothetical protein
MQALQRRFLVRNGMADSMVLTAFFLAAAYWGLEALINLFSPGEISFYREIFGPNVGGMGMRVIVLCLFLIFALMSVHHQQPQRAEQALTRAREVPQHPGSIEEGYYEVDPDGNFNFVNDATHRSWRCEGGTARPEHPAIPDRGSTASCRNIQECCAPAGPSGFDIELSAGRPCQRGFDGPAPEPGRETIASRHARDRTEKELEMDLLESNRKVQNARRL